MTTEHAQPRAANGTSTESTAGERTRGESAALADAPARGASVLASGFRPFFLLSAVHAMLFVPAWAAIWLGALPPPLWLFPTAWHVHEMTFGFVAAAVAGFLLTAVPVWTGAPPPRASTIAGLSGLWIAGRLAFACIAWLPLPIVAFVDLLFLPALTIPLAGPLLARDGPGTRRLLVAALVGWAVTNAGLHAAALGLLPTSPIELVHLPVHLILVIVVVVAGRLLPTFTRQGLARRGIEVEVRDPAKLVHLTHAALVGSIAIDGLALTTGLFDEDHSAGLRLFVACLLLIRWRGWAPLESRHDALLASLHLSFVWVPIGLMLEAASEASVHVPEAAGLHALGVGGFGGLILAMMTRVSLGHTGRPLVAPPLVPLSYAMLWLAALVRVGGSLLSVWARPSLMLAAALWSIAFALFLWVYTPMLLQPRTDGQPG